MLLRRRRPRLPTPAAPSVEDVAQTTELQRALRLGWAVAETFGRLRSYQPEFASRRNDPSELPRFSFSNGDLSGAQRLEVSYRQLIELARALDLEPPDLADLTNVLRARYDVALPDEDKKRLHGRLEEWSRAAWVQLNVRSAALGRAMTYGGSLTDTYWYMATPGNPAFLTGRQSVEALLRPHRLRRMQERMNEINDAFSADLCDAIGYSLGVWVYDDAKRAWAEADAWEAVGVAVEGQPSRTPAQQLHFNLFRQVRTWRDLVFESRQPLDYVDPGFRQRANIAAGAITIALVIAIALVVGLLVFTIFNVALRAVNQSPLSSTIQNEIIEAISIVVSLLSTLVVITAGLLARASAAVQQFDQWLETRLVRRAIREHIVVPWNEPPRRANDGT